MKDCLQFEFSSRLKRGGALFEVSVPQRISTALGKKGPVPVFAKICGVVEILVSLVPAGNGKHVLRLNAKTRHIAHVVPGDMVGVQITVPKYPIELPIPFEIADKLKKDGALEAFQSFPVGKQNHIIQWINAAAHEKTYQQRIQKTIEFAHQQREKSVDREKRK